MNYIVETRRQETEDSSATPWALVSTGEPDLYTFADHAEAERCAAELPALGDEWATCEYRVREARA